MFILPKIIKDLTFLFYSFNFYSSPFLLFCLLFIISVLFTFFGRALFLVLLTAETISWVAPAIWAGRWWVPGWPSYPPTFDIPLWLASFLGLSPRVLLS